MDKIKTNHLENQNSFDLIKTDFERIYKMLGGKGYKNKLHEEVSSRLAALEWPIDIDSATIRGYCPTLKLPPRTSNYERFHIVRSMLLGLSIQLQNYMYNEITDLSNEILVINNHLINFTKNEKDTRTPAVC